MTADSVGGKRFVASGDMVGNILPGTDGAVPSKEWDALARTGKPKRSSPAENIYRIEL